jgi:hypothetical protein
MRVAKAAWGVAFALAGFGAIVGIATRPGRSGSAERARLAKPGEIRRIAAKVGFREGEERGAPLKRALSSGGVPGGRCLRDRVGVEALRTEVTKREAGARRVTAVLGTWRAEVPAPQAAMLAVQSGRWFQPPASLDLSGCTEVVCVLNRLAGLPDADTLGLKIYGWYLRTGYVLGSTADVSEIEVSATQGRAPREFIFTPSELTAFWRLSFMIPESMKSMSQLTVLHRLPQGEVVSDWMDEDCPGFPGKDRLILRTEANRLLSACRTGGAGASASRSGDLAVWTCGDAGFQGSRYGNPGFIRLSDRCLDLGSDSRRLEGFFWTGVTHEMAHRLDYSIGAASAGSLRIEARSQSDEWKALSGWAIRETRGPDGRVLSRAWESDPTREGFVRSYAGTSPAEDWADSIAYARFDPQVLLQKAPGKAEYLRQNVFGGRSFTQEGLISEYRTRAVQAVRASLLEGVQECFATGGGASPSSEDAAVTLEGAWTTVLTAEVSRCIATQMGSRFAAAFDELRATEWEACDLLTPSQEAAFRSEGVTALLPDLERIVSQQAQVAEVLRASRELHERLSAQTDKREAFLRCQLEDDPRTCFSQAMAARFDLVVGDLVSRLGPTVETERRIFLTAQSYESAQEGVLGFYRQLFAGFEPERDRLVQRLAETCGSVAPEGPLVVTPFSGGTRYVAPGLLSCLNAGVPGIYAGIHRHILEPYGLTLSSEAALRFVERALFESGTLERLQAWVEREAERERTALDGTLGVSVAGLVQGLETGDLAWIRAQNSVGAVRAGCAERLAERALEKARELNPRFEAPESLAGRLSVLACERFVQSPSVQSQLAAVLEAERRAREEAWRLALGDLEGRVEAALVTRGADCRRQYPQRNSSARTQRARCLRDHWRTAKSEALRAWSVEGAAGAAFASRNSEASNAMETAKSRLIEGAMRRMEQ